MTQATIRSGQSAWDIALQEYGSIEAIAWMMADNNISGEFVVGDLEQEGQVLKIRDEVVNQSITDYFESRQITTY